MVAEEIRGLTVYSLRERARVLAGFEASSGGARHTRECPAERWGHFPDPGSSRRLHA